MPTSGTYVFAPSVGEIVIAAYARLQIHPTSITAEHMAHARREANFLQVEWSNKGPNLWAVDLQTVDTVEGVAAYDVPANTVMILDAYITQGDGDFAGQFNNPDFSVESFPTDLMIMPMSRSEYAAIPRKTTLARPTGYWFDRLIAPKIVLWPTPNAIYRLNYFRFRQIQDAKAASVGTPEIPYLMLDAMVAGLSHRLSRIYAPQLEALRKADAAEAWNAAAAQNTEYAPMHIRPDLSGYWG